LFSFAPARRAGGTHVTRIAGQNGGINPFARGYVVVLSRRVSFRVFEARRLRDELGALRAAREHEAREARAAAAGELARAREAAAREREDAGGRFEHEMRAQRADADALAGGLRAQLAARDAELAELRDRHAAGDVSQRDTKVVKQWVSVCVASPKASLSA